MRKLVALLLLCPLVAFGQSQVKVSALPAQPSAVQGSDVTIDDNGTTTYKATFSQVATYVGGNLPATIGSNTTGNAATATSATSAGAAATLSGSPTQCTGGQVSTGIAANGNANCTTPAGGGNVSNSGTPTSGQFAEWTNATTIAGETMTGDCTLATATITCLKTNGTSFGTFATANAATPPAIGGTTPAAGAFTTISASSTVSGSGFSAYLGSPPAIGGSAPAAGSFTTLSSSGGDSNTKSGAASTPAVTWSGAPFTGGSGTTTYPLLYVNDGTAPTTWSTLGTELGFNAPSGFTGNFEDFHVNGGASVCLLSYQGNFTCGTYNGTTIPTSATLLVSGGALGTPSSGNGSNLTNISLSAITGFGTGVETFLATPSATNLGSAVTGAGLVAGSNVTITGAWPNQTINASSSAGSAWNTLTSGTNTTMAAVMGSGSSLSFTGTGTVNANEIDGAAPPASATLTATNSSSQLTAVSIGSGLAVASAVLATTYAIDAQTGTSYTVSCTTDAGKLVTVSNSSAIAVTLNQATGGCGAGYGFDFQNVGTSLATLTPTTSTINGAASLIVAPGYGCSITSDGTNYQVSACGALQLNPAVQSATSATSVTPICGTNLLPLTQVTASATGTFTVNAPSTCTAANGMRLRVEIKSPSGGTITYSWNATYKASATLALPTTSNAASKEDDFEFEYSTAIGSSGWKLMAYNQGF